VGIDTRNDIPEKSEAHHNFENVLRAVAAHCSPVLPAIREIHVVQTRNLLSSEHGADNMVRAKDLHRLSAAQGIRRSRAQLYHHNYALAGQTRSNRPGRLAFRPLAIFSKFTRETFLTPRSTPE
jgi:hypothetical protein